MDRQRGYRDGLEGFPGFNLTMRELNKTGEWGIQTGHHNQITINCLFFLNSQK